jgi:hypothetical protein
MENILNKNSKILIIIFRIIKILFFLIYLQIKNKRKIKFNKECNLVTFLISRFHSFSSFILQAPHSIAKVKRLVKSDTTLTIAISKM